MYQYYYSSADVQIYLTSRDHTKQIKVDAALTIAYYCQEPEKAAIMSANLGGDTDTIGAMACAICGAYKGIDSIRPEWIYTLEKANNINFKNYTQKILTARKFFKL